MTFEIIYSQKGY